MADQSAHHYLTREIEHGNEDVKFTPGVAVFESESESVTLGGFYKAEATARGTCNRCGQHGHMVKDCPSKPRGQACRLCGDPEHNKINCPQLECGNCHELGHAKANCTTPLLCHACDMPGHTAKNCQLPNHKRKGKGKGKSKVNGSDDCKSCGKPGHHVINCPDQVCENCGKAGHLLDECTEGKIVAPVEASGSDKVDGDKVEGDKVEGEKVEGDKVEGEKVEGDKVEGEKVEGDCGDPPAAPDVELPPEPPKGTLPEASKPCLTAKLVTVYSEQHISSFGVTLEGCYQDQTTKKWCHKTASVAFTQDNLAEASVNSVSVVEDPDKDEDFMKYVTAPEQRELIKSQASLDGAAQLLHIKVRLRTVGTGANQGVGGSDRPLFGQALFSDLDFGEFEHDIGKARNMLLKPEFFTLHFFAVAPSTLFEERLVAVANSMVQQHAQDPILNWWEGGVVNPQRGMEIKEELRPTDFKIRKRYTFQSSKEYFTIFFHNLTHELDLLKESKEALTHIKIASFPGGEDQLYWAHLHIPYNSHYRTGTVLKLKFDPDADESDDWTFQITEPMGFTSAGFYPGYLFRPRDGDSFLAEPEFDKGTHLIESQHYETSAEIGAALDELRGIACLVRETSPLVGVTRAINTLNHLYLGGAAFAEEMQLLKANNLRDLAVVDYFHAMLEAYGDTAVEAGIDFLTKLLGRDQRRVVAYLRNMKGGILLLQGPGGVGKTAILVLLSKLHYWLQVHYGKDKRLPPLWVMSPMNKNLDDIAQKCHQACLDLYHEFQKQGIDAFYPIVIRRHMHATEKHVYRKEFEQKRNVQLKTSKPLYYDADEAAKYVAEQQAAGADSDDDDDVDEEAAREKWLQGALPMVATVKMQDNFIRGVDVGFDKRLTNVQLSEGMYIRHRAGFPMPGTDKLHPIADPSDKHAEFRFLLRKMGEGAVMETEELKSITLGGNVIAKEIAEICIVICMSPDTLSQHRSHSLTSPYAVLHDEAGKTPEMGTLAGLLFSRPYTKAPLVIEPNSRKPQLLFGDIFQPTPALANDRAEHPFGQQTTVSLFQRWVIAGLFTMWMWEQHRSNTDIIKLVNSILPRGEMLVAPGVDSRPSCLLAAQCARDIFAASTRTVFVRLGGEMSVLPSSKSRYNDKFVPYVLKSAYELLKAGRFGGEQIAIMSPYTAQVATYSHVKQRFVEYLLQLDKESEGYRIGMQLKDVDVFTVDKMQGAQKDVILYCTTCSGPLGFTAEVPRQLLALGRAAAMLVIFGDPRNVSDAYPGHKQGFYQKSAYYKAWYHCYKGSSVLNLEHDMQNPAWALPDDFDIKAVLHDFHADPPPEEAPLLLAPNAKYPAEAVPDETGFDGDGGFNGDGGFGGDVGFNGGGGGDGDGGFNGGGGGDGGFNGGDGGDGGFNDGDGGDGGDGTAGDSLNVW